MRDTLRKIWEKLKKPRGWALVFVYLVTVVFIVGALVILLVDYEGTALEILAYALFALAAITLAYSVYTIVIYAPKMKGMIENGLTRYAFTNRLMNSYGFRTVIFSIGSFVISVAYGVYNGVLGILSRSIWYGALAAYYILLAFLRGGILLYQNKKRKRGVKNEALTEAEKYRNGGWILLLLNIALSSAIAQMIFDDQGFHYQNWTIYASAAYAFYKITMSIINLFKARAQDDLTVQAIRNINLVDAMVSVLALQTALLFTFRTENLDVSLFNTLTGSVVSLCVLVLSVGMIVRANKRIKEIKSENTNGERI